MSRLLPFLFVAVLTACGNPSSQDRAFATLQGTTMGTYYRILYHGPFVDQKAIDQLLAGINKSVSTYDSTSLIRVVNSAPAGQVQIDTFGSTLQEVFWDNLKLAIEVSQASDGAFDPTILPLVNYWGFGYAEQIDNLSNPPKEIIDKIGFENWQIDLSEKRLIKTMEGVCFDFSALAKGYGVDKVAHLLEQNRITDYLVDVGGEMRAKGDGPSGDQWRVGINRPAEKAAPTDYEMVLKLSAKALATSGNYRNYRTLESGRKVSHSINPKTGSPERSDLLSATIIANDAAEADAWATACMIMGITKSLQVVEELDEVEGLFIASDDSGIYRYEMTSGFEMYIQENSN